MLSHLTKSNVPIYIGLAVLAAAVFAGVARNEFVGFDDDYYITGNPVVRAGLTWEGARWAFTTFELSNWHPLTWLSHMADVQLFGMNPVGHHLMGLALHIASALLLYRFLSSATGERGKSYFVAAIFAIHPLHVESVAWAAERKDVLSHLFFMLLLLAYGRYARRPGWLGYAGVAVLLALGLMAKPMLVSVPVLLLLLDYWPLQRFSLERGQWRDQWPAMKRCILEKMPLAVLCAASAAVTVMAQHAGGAVRTLEAVPLPARVLNAALAYCTYMVKAVLPLRLAVLYPYPETVPVIKALAAVLALIVVTVLAVGTARRQRFFAVGWLWFVVSLVPVIGLIQVGGQSHADRYTYLPYTGLFICAAWGVPLALGRLPHRGKLLTACAAAALALLGAATVYQVTFWKDSLTLFGRAIAVTQRNAVAHYNLGCTYLKKGEYKAAAENLTAALKYRPDDLDALTNLGVVMLSAGELDKAVLCLEQVLAKKPEYQYASYNLSLARYQQKQYALAAEAAGRIVAANPAYTPAKSLLGRSLYYLGRNEEAARLLREVLDAEPDNREASQYLFKITGNSR